MLFYVRIVVFVFFGNCSTREIMLMMMGGCFVADCCYFGVVVFDDGRVVEWRHFDVGIVVGHYSRFQ